MVRIEPRYQRSSFDEYYWLSHCDGYRVETPKGRFGMVENVRFKARLDRPDELLIRHGILRRRLVAVNAEDVAVIAPREQRLRLKSTPEPEAAAQRRHRSRVSTWHPLRS